MIRRRATGAIVAALASVASVATLGTGGASASLGVGDIDTYAGGPGWGPATEVAQWPVSVAADDASIYTADAWHGVVRALDKQTGEQRIVAGTGLNYQPDAADGTPAAALTFSAPTAVAVAANGDLFVADGGYDAYWFDETKVWRIDHVTGAAHTYLGGGDGTCEPDRAACPLATVRLTMPRALAFDGDGNLFVADAVRNRVLRVDAATSTVRTVAGTHSPLGTGTCYQTCDVPGHGDGGPATLAMLRWPNAVAVDAAGRALLIADFGHGRVRQVDLVTGIITTVAGNGQEGRYVDGVPAVAASLNSLTGVAFNPAGGFDVTDGGAVRHVDPTTTLMHTVRDDAGIGLEALAFDHGDVGDDGDGASIIVADLSGRQVVRIGEDGTAVRIAGNGRCCWGGNGGPARGAMLSNAVDVALGANGDVFLAEHGTVGPNDAGFVRRIGADERIAMFAGTGRRGTTGDGGPATGAQLDMPTSVAVGGDGSVYIGDAGALGIRRVSPSGVISTVAGTMGVDGDQGEGVLATEARVAPSALAVDPAGRLVMAEQHRIRRIDADGRIRTIAGDVGQAQGFAGDGGLAADARFCGIHGLAYDAAGNLLVADRGNHRVRRITPSGAVSTVAGSGPACNSADATPSGDGGPATAAIVEAWDVAVDSAGVVYIGDRHAVRRVGTDGVISTIAGNGTNGIGGDGGAATDAAVGVVHAIAVDDGTDRLYIVQHASFTHGAGNRVRVVQLG